VLHHSFDITVAQVEAPVDDDDVPVGQKPAFVPPTLFKIKVIFLSPLCSHAQNVYASRCLPSIIGSADYEASYHAGIAVVEEEKEVEDLIVGSDAESAANVDVAAHVCCLALLCVHLSGCRDHLFCSTRFSHCIT
jgi:hypothetical protein